MGEGGGRQDNSFNAHLTNNRLGHFARNCRYISPFKRRFDDPPVTASSSVITNSSSHQLSGVCVHETCTRQPHARLMMQPH